jgi:carbonic anhydrase/acetyltransferase-like protein (isoleucine patch superfamily)
VSKGLATVAALERSDAPGIATSAVVIGEPAFGSQSLLSEGAVVRAEEGAVAIGAGSAVIENCVVIGKASMPTAIGRRTVFGHRCLVVGASIGDLCEIGNASILMPGCRLGDRVFLGEGTLVPPDTELPSDVVAVGRPARVIRTASQADLDRLRGLRGGDLTLPPPTFTTFTTVRSTLEGLGMGQLYSYRDITPTIATSAVLFPTAEITGDVVIGERCIIGAGVKIIGDSHGPVRIGNDVQILENTVLHLLPDNELIIDNGVTIGPGAMIHGCQIGARSVVEPGAIVCDGSTIGTDCVVRAGAVVKQRSRFSDKIEIDGFPADEIQRIEAPERPDWALPFDDLPTVIEVPTPDDDQRKRRPGSR